MKNLLIAALVIAGVWQFVTREGSVTLGPGVMAPNDPVQVDTEKRLLKQTSDYNISGFATFDLTAKVLAKENYSMDREAELSPVDLALGWGNMSDESVLTDIDISQSGRFYYWQVNEFPIPRREIETHSANMHMIPATDSVADALSSVRAGDIIELSGDLVEIDSLTDNWYWRSSKTRNDVGAGACEVILVSSLRVVTPQS